MSQHPDSGGAAPRSDGSGDMRADVRDGMVASLPAVVAVVPFGLLLGAMAAQKGLSPLEVMLMSGLVFAGSAQFVAIDLWTEPAPWLLLATTTLMVNCRHLLMGASLAPRIAHFGNRQGAAALFVMADEVWALSEQRARSRRVDFAFMAALGGSLWAMWVATTTLGAGLGTAIGDPARYGFDFAFTAIFITLIVGLWRGAGSGVAVAASAAVATGVYLTVDGPWYIAAGALAGAAAGAAMGPQRTQAPPP